LHREECIGGDEFAVILHEATASVADEGVRRISRSPEFIEGKVSIAFGVSTVESKEQIIGTLKQSDERMYLDKSGQKEL